MRHRQGKGRTGPRDSVWAPLLSAFRERQIYLRSDGEVRYIVLRPRAQLAAFLAVVLGVAWVAYASLGHALKKPLPPAEEQRLLEAHLDYEDRIAAMRQAIDLLNDKLLLDQKGYLDEVDEVRREYEQLVERQRLLTEFLRRGRLGQRAATPSGIVEPEEAPASSSTSKGSLNELSFSRKYAAPFKSRGDALRPLAELRQMFGSFDEHELATLDELNRLGEARIQAVAGLFERLGIDGRSLAAESYEAPSGFGGPFIAASAADLSSERASERFSEAVLKLAIEERLKRQFLDLPVTLPLDGSTEVSSGFGLRRDPFRRVPAMHSGIDLRGPNGAPVLATAPGTVIKAGWDGPYGRLVEIVHENGASTRYAHLRSIEVTVGQQLARGDAIGVIGSTGRSTGPHLHYETRINGRAIDPARFWKARDVLQSLSPQR